MTNILRVKAKVTKIELVGRFVGLLIIVGAATQWFVHKDDITPFENANPDSIVYDTKRTSAVKSSFVSHEDTSKKVSESMDPLTAADVAAHKEWLKDMGYSATEEKDNYAYYDEKMLNELAKNNDLLAIKVLAQKAIDKHDFESAKKYYWQAAALDSTPALDQLALFDEPTPYDKEQGMDYVKSKLFDELAIYKVVEIRGDIKLARVGAEGARRNYEHYFGKLELSQEDAQQINLLAEKKYAELEAARAELGLGRFKNSTSKLIKVIESK